MTVDKFKAARANVGRREALQTAKRQIQEFVASPPSDTNQWNSQLRGIINQLATVKAGTTSYQDAQQMQQFAQKRIKP